MPKYTSQELVDLPFFKKIIDLLPGHIYWKDLQFRYLGCNSQQAMSLGLRTPQEIVGKTDYDLSLFLGINCFRCVGDCLCRALIFGI